MSKVVFPITHQTCTAASPDAAPRSTGQSLWQLLPRSRLQRRCHREVTSLPRDRARAVKRAQFPRASAKTVSSLFFCSVLITPPIPTLIVGNPPSQHKKTTSWLSVCPDLTSAECNTDVYSQPVCPRCRGHPPQHRQLQDPDSFVVLVAVHCHALLH
jgi:hypothetical protein